MPPEKKLTVGAAVAMGAGVAGSMPLSPGAIGELVVPGASGAWVAATTGAPVGDGVPPGTGTGGAE